LHCICQLMTQSGHSPLRAYQPPPGMLIWVG